MSRAEAKLARRSLRALVQATFVLLFAGLSLTAYNAHVDALNAAQGQHRVVAHIIENWPGSNLHANAPRHVASEEASRIRVKVRAWESDSTIAKRVLVPVLPSRRAANFLAAWPPVFAHTGLRPRPYDPQGPPLQVV